MVEDDFILLATKKTLVQETKSGYFGYVWPISTTSIYLGDDANGPIHLKEVTTDREAHIWISISPAPKACRCWVPSLLTSTRETRDLQTPTKAHFCSHETHSLTLEEDNQKIKSYSFTQTQPQICALRLIKDINLWMIKDTNNFFYNTVKHLDLRHLIISK